LQCQELANRETALRREIEETLLRTDQPSDIVLEKREPNMLAAGPHQDVDKRITAEDMERMKLALARSQLQCQEMANRETALRREIEEALMRKHEDNLSSNVSPSNQDMHFYDEIEQLKHALVKSHKLCEVMANTETALRREIEEKLILTDEQTDGDNIKLHDNVFASNLLSAGRDELTSVEDIDKLKEALNRLSTQCKDLAHIESALRSEIEDALLVKDQDIEVELAHAQLLAFDACQSELERYKQQLLERSTEVSILEDKLRDFAIRFDEQAAEFQQALRQTKRTSMSDPDTAKLVAEIESLKTKLAEEIGKNQPTETKTICEVDQRSHEQLTSVPLVNISNEKHMETPTEMYELNRANQQHIEKLQKENISLKQKTDDLQKEIKALRKTVAEQSLYLVNTADAVEQQEKSDTLENSTECILESIKPLENVMQPETEELPVQRGKDMHKAEFSLRAEIEDLLTQSTANEELTSCHPSRSLGSAGDSTASFWSSIQTMQKTERALRLEIEESVTKESGGGEINNELSSLAEKNAILSDDRIALLKEIDQLRHRFASTSNVQVEMSHSSFQVVPSMSIDRIANYVEGLNDQILKLTSDLSEKDAYIEKERKQFNSEIESLRKELAISPRRMSGFEKSNDLMIAQMEIQISHLLERVKELENLKEENANLKMANQRLKSEVEKEQQKRYSKNSNSSEDDISDKNTPTTENVSVSLMPELKHGRDDIDGVFEDVNETANYAKQLILPEDTQRENDLLRDEIAALSLELEKQKTIASNMLAPIGADDDMLVLQIAALNTKVKDLQTEKQSLSGIEIQYLSSFFLLWF